MKKVTDTESFIEKAKEIHKNKYDYSLVVYVNTKTKVTIICPEHGEFEQSPNNHLSGYGCNKCASIAKKENQLLPTTYWIKKAKAIHGDVYDYSLLPSKTNSKTPVPIVCPIHGIFEQSLSNHTHKTKSQGCPKCGDLYRGEKRKLTQEEFEAKAVNVHGDKYLYNNDYIGYHTKVKITCPLHGDFKQTPAHHLSGTGCPSCASYGFSLTKPAILYYLEINNGEAYKIGITNKSVEERFNVQDLKTLKIINTWKFKLGINAYKAERLILSTFTDYKYLGSNLLSSGNTELFNTDIFKLDEISAIMESLYD